MSNRTQVKLWGKWVGIIGLVVTLISGCQGEARPTIPPTQTTTTPTEQATQTLTVTVTCTATPTFKPTTTRTITPTATPEKPKLGIMDVVRVNCPQPETYKGKYRGVEVPVTLTTDESYGNVVVKLADPAFAGSLSEAVADAIYRLNEEAQNTGLSLEQFMAGWANGTITKITVRVNDPSNENYVAEKTTLDLRQLEIQMVFLNGKNYRWKDLVFYNSKFDVRSGMYIVGNKLIVLADITNNHKAFVKSELDPYGAQNDFGAALALNIIDSGGSGLNTHIRQVKPHLVVEKARGCSD